MYIYYFLAVSDIEKGVARRQELKNAALEAKRSGNQSEALKLVRLVKVLMFKNFPLKVTISIFHFSPIDL